MRRLNREQKVFCKYCMYVRNRYFFGLLVKDKYDWVCSAFPPKHDYRTGEEKEVKCFDKNYDGNCERFAVEPSKPMYGSITYNDPP